MVDDEMIDEMVGGEREDGRWRIIKS